MNAAGESESKLEASLANQFLRYLIGAGLGFVLDFGLLWLLAGPLRWNYLVAAAVAFSGGLLLNYVLSVSWVFQSRSVNNRWVELSMFALVGIVGLFLNELVMYFGTQQVHLDYRLSKLISVPVVLAWNFSARKALLFRGVS
jgi:putative flippase GtrA